MTTAPGVLLPDHFFAKADGYTLTPLDLEINAVRKELTDVLRVLDSTSDPSRAQSLLNKSTRLQEQLKRLVEQQATARRTKLDAACAKVDEISRGDASGYTVKRSSPGGGEPDTFFVQSEDEECVGDKDFKTRGEAEAYARQCAARDRARGDADQKYTVEAIGNNNYTVYLNGKGVVKFRTRKEANDYVAEKTGSKADGSYEKAKDRNGNDIKVYIPTKNEAYGSAGDTRYNPEAVQKEINKDKRIGKGEASTIHRLLKGRTG